jgi:hypothetical protein
VRIEERPSGAFADGKVHVLWQPPCPPRQLDGIESRDYDADDVATPACVYTKTTTPATAPSSRGHARRTLAQALEVEQESGEALFEDGEGFGGAKEGRPIQPV